MCIKTSVVNVVCNVRRLDPIPVPLSEGWTSGPEWMKDTQYYIPTNKYFTCKWMECSKQKM